MSWSDLTVVYESDCRRCDWTLFGPISGFAHDWRCWGFKLACRNLKVRIDIARGVLELY